MFFHSMQKYDDKKFVNLFETQNIVFYKIIAHSSFQYSQFSIKASFTIIAARKKSQIYPKTRFF